MRSALSAVVGFSLTFLAIATMVLVASTVDSCCKQQDSIYQNGNKRFNSVKDSETNETPDWYHGFEPDITKTLE